MIDPKLVFLVSNGPCISVPVPWTTGTNPLLVPGLRATMAVAPVVAYLGLSGTVSKGAQGACMLRDSR